MQQHWLPVALTAACLISGGCTAAGSAGGSSQSAASRPPTTAASDLSAQLAANQKAADTEARRLIALARVPSGAIDLSAPPPEVTAELGGTPPGPMADPGGSSLVDKARFWRVRLSVPETLAWVRAHPPDGLRYDGSGSGFGPNGFVSASVSYSAPSPRVQSTDLFQGAAYLVNLVSLADGGTAIRADGQAMWIDPRPLRDDKTGPRLRVDVASGCPQNDHWIAGVTNTGADLDQALLPMAVPTSGLICEYGRIFQFVGLKHLDAASAGRVADTVAAIALHHSDGMASSCPMGDASMAVIALTYPGRPDVDLLLNPEGCRWISNGHIEARMYDEFDAWIPFAAMGEATPTNSPQATSSN
jgi:hypothetical protein